MPFNKIEHKQNIYKAGRKSRLRSFINANGKYLSKSRDYSDENILNILAVKIELNSLEEEYQAYANYGVLSNLLNYYIKADFYSGWEILEAFYSKENHDFHHFLEQDYELLEIGIIYSYIKKFYELNPHNDKIEILLKKLLGKLESYKFFLSLNIVQEFIDICEAIQEYRLRESFVYAFNILFKELIDPKSDNVNLDIASLCCSAFGHQIMYPIAWYLFFQLGEYDTEISKQKNKSITVFLNKDIYETPSSYIEAKIVRPIFKDFKVNYVDLQTNINLDSFGYHNLPCSAWSLDNQYLDRHTGPSYMWYLHEIKEIENNTYPNKLPEINLNHDEFQIFQSKFLGLYSEKIVAVHIKTGAYKGVDQSHRSFELGSYARLIEHMANEYKVIILGEVGVYESICSIIGHDKNIQSIENIYNRHFKNKVESIQVLELYIIKSAIFFITSYSGNSQLAKLLRKPALLLGGPSRGVLYDPYIMQVATDYEELRITDQCKDYLTTYLATTPGGSIECNRKKIKDMNQGEILISAFELYKYKVNDWYSQHSNKTLLGPFSVARAINCIKSLDKVIQQCHKQRIKDWIHIISS